MWKLPDSTPFAFPRECWSFKDLPRHFAVLSERLKAHLFTFLLGGFWSVLGNRAAYTPKAFADWVEGMLGNQSASCDV